MAVNQVSVFLENKVGRLAEVTRILGEKGVNIRALSIADTTEFGILRMILTRPDEVRGMLEEAGFTVSETEVIVVEVPDEPGGLAKVLSSLREARINMEYLYAFVAPQGKNALVVMKVEKIEEARELLEEKKVKILTSREIETL